MAGEVKLIGHDDLEWLTTFGSNSYIVIEKCQGEASGQVTEIRIKVSDVCNVKGAIYDASKDLVAATTGNEAVAGWNALTIYPVDVLFGEYYYIAVLCDTASRLWSLRGAAFPGSGYRSGYYYSSPFPAHLPTFSSSNYARAFAGWGTLASGGAGRLIGVGDPSMITVGHPKLISAGLSPGLIRGP